MTGAFTPWEPGVFALSAYAFLVVAVTGVLLFLCSRIGEKRSSLEKGRAYECGVIPTGSAWFRYPVPFYLTAIFFLIFDVEAAFIFSWAVAFDELGLLGYLRITLFIIVLLFSLFYVWRKGALDWKKAN